MNIKLQRVANARDLGGIVTPYGKIRFNRLIRSGHVASPTQNDVQVLKAIGVRRIIDLRTETEMAKHPDKLPNVEIVNISIMSTTTFGINYEKMDGDTIAARLQAGIERMRARGEDPMEHMRIIYRTFAETESSRRGYGKFLKLLANDPVEGATLWHCTGGKDRCGTCSALLLYCLGASSEDIMRDYLETNVQTAAHLEKMRKKVRPFVTDEQFALVNTLLPVDESYINTFWRQIDEQFGGLKGFLEACGVTQQDVENLRKNYLE